jgi:hypothetical protein
LTSKINEDDEPGSVDIEACHIRAMTRGELRS